MSIKMDVYDIVCKLIGPIEPVGDSGIDSRRLENLSEMTGLVDALLTDIDDVAHDFKDRHEDSLKQASKHADKFLRMLEFRSQE